MVPQSELVFSSKWQYGRSQKLTSTRYAALASDLDFGVQVLHAVPSSPFYKDWDDKPINRALFPSYDSCSFEGSLNWGQVDSCTDHLAPRTSYSATSVRTASSTTSQPQAGLPWQDTRQLGKKGPITETGEPNTVMTGNTSPTSTWKTLHDTAGTG